MLLYITKPLKGPINQVRAGLEFVRLKCSDSHFNNKLPTLSINSELPKDLSSIPSHELFVKSGFFHHPRPGLVHWLPIGFMILLKVENVIRKRMVEIEGEEVMLSSLSSRELWEKTGRWKNSELYKLKDSNDDEYCLAATCEEEITSLVKSTLKSYKELPQLYFQINKKYRDERRPRLGLLRGREFIMKDAYSFDVDEASALDMYEKVVGGYYKIFEDLKIPFVKADADTGDIGGSLSHEWHYLHKTAGEDTLFTCDECKNSSNVEKTTLFPHEVQKGVEVNVRYYKTLDSGSLVCVYYPSGRDLEEGLLKLAVVDIDLDSGASPEPAETDSKCDALLTEFSSDDMSKKVIRIMDSRLDHTSRLPDFPIPFINRSFITTLFDTPVVSAQEGEICGICENGTLQKHKSIEVGHTFYLGEKYTKPLDLSITLPTGKKLVVMGCYGIGVSRIVAAIGETLRDSKGFKWPNIIAPWSATVIKASDVETSLFDQLDSSEISYKIDSRKLGLGKKIKDSNLIGIPLTVIIGKNYPNIEIEVRGERFSSSPLEWEILKSNSSFNWEVIPSINDKPEKHIVHISGFIPVIKAILKDM